MSKQLISFVCFGVMLLGITACSTSPTYINDAEPAEAQSINTSLNPVHYRLEDSFTTSPPKCIAVLPFEKAMEQEQATTGENKKYTLMELDDKAMAKLRRNLYAHLAPYPYHDIELVKLDKTLADANIDPKDYAAVGKALNCDAVLDTQVTDYHSQFFGVFSQTAIGVNMKLIRAENGQLLWEGHHVATSHGGGLPLTPIDFALGLFSATENVSDEKQIHVAGDVFRRLLSTWDNVKVAAPTTVTVASKQEQEKEPQAIEKESTSSFYVASYKLFLRSGPGKNYKAAAVLDKNDELTLLDDQFAPWVQVKLADGQLGYVNKKYISSTN